MSSLPSLIYSGSDDFLSFGECCSISAGLPLRMGTRNGKITFLQVSFLVFGIQMRNREEGAFGYSGLCIETNFLHGLSFLIVYYKLKE